MINKSDYKKAIKNKLVLVEGEDEEYLIDALLGDLELDNDIQVMGIGGKDKFPEDLKTLKKGSDFEIVTSLGVMRDADNDPCGAFQSVCGALERAGVPVPIAPMQQAEGHPSVTIIIIPDSNRKGMLENICLDSISDDPVIVCIDNFFNCLKDKKRVLAENVIPKARVRAFLASREWLEIAYFEYLQECMANYVVNPLSPAVIVPRTHLFLASRYTPDLRLGIASKKTGDRYWDFNHSAFDKLKVFLKSL
jgi:hypothetical protein